MNKIVLFAIAGLVLVSGMYNGALLMGARNTAPIVFIAAVFAIGFSMLGVRAATDAAAVKLGWIVAVKVIEVFAILAALNAPDVVGSMLNTIAGVVELAGIWVLWYTERPGTASPSRTRRA